MDDLIGQTGVLHGGSSLPSPRPREWTWFHALFRKHPSLSRRERPAPECSFRMAGCAGAPFWES